MEYFELGKLRKKQKKGEKKVKKEKNIVAITVKFKPLKGNFFYDNKMNKYYIYFLCSLTK